MFTTIGKDISQCQSVSEALHTADLDYHVVKVPIYYQDGISYKSYPSKMLTQRDDLSKVYGVVSPKYKVCQNLEAFSFLDYLVEENGLKFSRAGETDSGIAYIIARLPDVDVVEDKFRPYVVFQNSHNGQSSIRANVLMSRMICQNYFNVAFPSAMNVPNTIRIVHSSGMHKQLVAAQQMIQGVDKYVDTFKATAENMHNKPITSDGAIKVFSEIVSSEPMAINEFISCYLCDDNNRFIGTEWGVVNGVAGYLTHCSSSTQNEVQPFDFFKTSDTLSTLIDRLGVIV